MQPELALKAISHTVIAIFLVTLLFVPLISLRKELTGDAPLRTVFQFGFVIIGFCTVVALMGVVTPTLSDAINSGGRRYDFPC